MPLAKYISLAAALSTVTAISAADQRTVIPVDMLHTMPDLEVTLWADSPMVHNPTNIDTDKDGRIWVAEGVRYRSHHNRQPEGDRIMVLEDTDGDGKADKSWVFVQEPYLQSPLGIAVIDNKIVVSQSPDMIIYTDVNRDLKFEPGVDKREVLLTGFNGFQHDHSLHSITVGPDGEWYWNVGNCGANFTDRSGKSFHIGSAYGYGGNPQLFDATKIAGMKSDDGHVYIGGFAARMNPDGTAVHVIGNNFRNSYEQTVTSFGDVFQNDNDDPPACYVAFLMEYGNAGFCSFDGQRSWGADRRPGQDTPTAEWRQEDPGTMPVGDVYGGGAPTGIAYYENGVLGKKYEGMLMSCEPGRNTVFGYFPEPEGAGFKLKRFNFLTSNQEEEFAGSDFKGGRPNDDFKTRFRPSDVVVGADGAIYVSDWFDPRVGGHADLDDTVSGAIYRVAPKGNRPSVPKFDQSTKEGQIAALTSPAVNVRVLGRTPLRNAGSDSIPAVSKLLNDDNEYIQARAIWLLSQLSMQGLDTVKPELENKNPKIRTAAYRALSRDYLYGAYKNTKDLIALDEKMAHDPSPAVRREVALSLRDIPFSQCKDVIRTLFQGYHGNDRWYLEALGTASSGKEAQVYDMLAADFGSDDSLKWSGAFADIAWRLHVPAATESLKARALAGTLPIESRKAAIVALAYTGTKDSSWAILDAAKDSSGPVQAEAMWWLLNRKDSLWKDYGLNEELKKCGLYDPDKVQLTSIVTPEPPQPKLQVDEVLKLKGDPARGKQLATACQTCHKIGDDGTAFGPDITAFAKMQPAEVVVRAIITPSADISHGYDGTVLETKDGTIIHGIVLANGDPTVIASQGGVIQMVPRKQIKSHRELGRSLMLGAEQLGMGAQEVADVVAYLRSLK